MLQLSKRLQAVAELVGECSTIADVGTDHGYIPVYLVAVGKARRAIAMDINEGPLSRAKEHILQYGLEQKIETRLSDGCLALKPKEADVIVIAGMGGALMQRILTQGGKFAGTARKLVLQPQSEITAFREFLLRQGYRIVAEDMVLEDGKYYPMMAAEPVKKEAYAAVRDAGKGQNAAECGTRIQEKGGCHKAGKEQNAGECGTRTQEKGGCHGAESEQNVSVSGKKREGADLLQSSLACKFGPRLLEQRHPVLKQYLLRQQKQKQKILENMKANARQDVAARTEELSQELADIETALEIYFTGKEPGL